MLFLLPLTRGFRLDIFRRGRGYWIASSHYIENKLVVPGRVELPTHPCEGYVITVSPQN